VGAAQIAGPFVKKAAVILLSGGLDSATTLALARAQGLDCYALSVAYGQRHSAELDAATRVARALGVLEHRTMRVDLAGIGGSALTDSRIAVPEAPTAGIPSTYVPARNTLLLALALGWAEVLGSQDIFIGANAVDYAGYPDCRAEFIAAFERMAVFATRAGVEGHPCRVHAPLISWTKAQIICEGLRLGVDFGATVSCYQADEFGHACGRCDSCRIRKSGFEAAGVPDPTQYRAV
jgi:7-cyano-7-deazaguanine synthase